MSLTDIWFSTLIWICTSAFLFINREWMRFCQVQVTHMGTVLGNGNFEGGQLEEVINTFLGE